MLGAKTVELDERIPFISKLRRQTHLPYHTNDFRKCECELLKELAFTLQFTTLIDWIDTILSIGAAFDSDELQSDNVLREKNNNSLPIRLKYIIKIFTIKAPITMNNQQSKQLKEKKITQKYLFLSVPGLESSKTSQNTKLKILLKDSRALQDDSHSSY
jgi:hypothetical protein